MNMTVIDTPIAITTGAPPEIPWVGLLIGVALFLGVVLYLAVRRPHSLKAFAAGLLLGVRSLLAKELRSRSRGWRPMWLLTGYLSALTLAVAGFLALAGQAGGTVSPNLGTSLFSTLAYGTVLLVAFITPALTVGTISGERERRTLDLLLVTQSSALGLVCGKLLGAMFSVLFLLIASLPAFALVYLFGGVPLVYLVLVLAVAAVTALAHAALGLLLSALLKRTALVSVMAYLAVLGLVFGVPVASAVAGAQAGPSLSIYAMAAPRPMPVPSFMGPFYSPPGIVWTGPPMQQPGKPPPAFAYASPMASLASVLPFGMGGVYAGLFGSSVGGEPRPAGIDITQAVYAVRTDPATGQVETLTTWAPWVYHFMFSGAITLLSLLIAALALAPVKPWRAVRVRRRRAGAVSHA
jgi:ABC-type transport system involved in multi-copper enzyme maturation permease subunit